MHFSLHFEFPFLCTLQFCKAKFQEEKKNTWMYAKNICSTKTEPGEFSCDANSLVSLGRKHLVAPEAGSAS